MLTKWDNYSSTEMCEGILSSKQLLCQIFDPSCSTAHAWVDDFGGRKKVADRQIIRLLRSVFHCSVHVIFENSCIKDV